MAICAIHQPNFFPWLGYFDKIRRADMFVFLDNVAYPKSGSGSGSWVNRVRIPIHNTPAWITCPIRREHGTQTIRNVHIDDAQPWRRKLLRTLDINYRRAINYTHIMPMLEELVMFDTDKLCQFNLHAIMMICQHLGIESNFILQSELATQKASTALLVELTTKVGADTYLCGGGAGEYQEDEMFVQHGVKLRYQNYVPVVYGDAKRFIPGMSVIDFLMTDNRRCQV